MSIHPPSPAHNSSRTTVRRARYTESLLNRAYTDALPILRAAIADEDALAMGLLGTLYMLGHGVDKDEQEAYLWFRQGAVRGDVPSQTALGLSLAGGRGTSINLSEAVFWLIHAGHAGSSVAIEMLDWLIMRHPSLDGKLDTAAQITSLIERHRAVMPRTSFGSHDGGVD